MFHVACLLRVELVHGCYAPVLQHLATGVNTRGSTVEGDWRGVVGWRSGDLNAASE